MSKVYVGYIYRVGGTTDEGYCQEVVEDTMEKAVAACEEIIEDYEDWYKNDYYIVEEEI